MVSQTAAILGLAPTGNNVHVTCIFHENFIIYMNNITCMLLCQCQCTGMLHVRGRNLGPFPCMLHA